MLVFVHVFVRVWQPKRVWVSFLYWVSCRSSLTRANPSGTVAPLLADAVLCVMVLFLCLFMEKNKVVWCLHKSPPYHNPTFFMKQTSYSNVFICVCLCVCGAVHVCLCVHVCIFVFVFVFVRKRCVRVCVYVNIYLLSNNWQLKKAFYIKISNIFYSLSFS